MPLHAVNSPSVVWSKPVGFLKFDPVTVELEVPPPVKTLHDAERIHWEPRSGVALCVAGGERRPLTTDECHELLRWAVAVQTAALDARDGGTTLAVVIDAEVVRRDAEVR